METLKLTITLGLICLVSGALLAAANHYTAGRIAQVRTQQLVDSLRGALPPFDNSPIDDKLLIDQPSQGKVAVYRGTQGGRGSGYAFGWTTRQGYSGEIKLLIGLNAKGRIHGLHVLQHAETPGLGAKIATPEFLAQFKGKGLTTTRWAVKKDGGDVDAIAGATISPRAVAGAVKAGLTFFERHRRTITGGRGGKAHGPAAVPIFAGQAKVSRRPASTPASLRKAFGQSAAACRPLVLVLWHLSESPRAQENRACLAEQAAAFKGCMCQIDWKHKYTVPTGDERVRTFIKNALSGGNWKAAVQGVCGLSDAQSVERLTYLIKLTRGGKLCTQTIRCVSQLVKACPQLEQMPRSQ